MTVIGLVGKIGSGKSVFAAYLKELGAAVVNADQIARQIVEPNLPAWKEIADTFGQAYFLPDGHINRPKLAQKIFAADASRLQLNAITHPRIRSEAALQIAAYKKEGYALIVLEAAVLLEAGFAEMVDEIWLLESMHEDIYQRLEKRDGLDIASADMRLQAQLSNEEMEKKADLVIINNGTLEDLSQKAKDLYNRATGKLKNIEKN